MASTGHILIFLFLFGAIHGETTPAANPCKSDTCLAGTYCQQLPANEDNAYKCIENGYRFGNCSLNTIETCAVDTKCIEKPDRKSYTCQCEDPIAVGDGIRKDRGGTGCTLPFKPCTEDKNCPQYGFCDSTVGHCKCKEGFQGDGFNCTDIIDCPSPECDPNAICDDFPGGFNCTCDGKRNYRGNGTFCEYKCNTDNDCDPPRGQCNGNADCECRAGYSGDGLTCVDINECTTPNLNDCPDGAYCINKSPGFDCKCKNGYFGDGRNCKALPKNCNEINNMKKGHVYIIDPDGTGPANYFEVECDVLFGEIVTILNPTGSFPLDPGPKKTNVPVPYEPTPEDIKPLLENSGFCSQDIVFDCEPSYKLFPGTKWVDAYGKQHENWGSTLLHKCACGEIGVCANDCYCDGNPSNPFSTKDKGKIVDKTTLPVMGVLFDDNTSKKGKIDIGPLICTKNPVGIPKDCHEAKFKYRIKKDQPMYIDVDGPGGLDPFIVYCDMSSFDNVGITEIPPTTPDVTIKTKEGDPIDYLVPGDKMKGLIKGSVYCQQYVEFECSHSQLMGGDGYVTVGSDKRRLDYFPGADGVQGKCGCGATKSCQDPTVTCNCNINDGKTRKDFGLLINKNDLPVVHLNAQYGGQTSSKYSVGPLRCAGSQFGLEPNCEKYRATGVNEDYSYFIDPDGPGKLEPFLVECKFVPNPPQGKTIVHHEKEVEEDLNDLFDLKYLTVSPEQIDALKDRSTYCSQEVTVDCTKLSLNSPNDIEWMPSNSSNLLSLTKFMPTCNDGNGCECDGSGTSKDKAELVDLGYLPIDNLVFDKIQSQLQNGGKGSITVGPLICSEVFPTCAHLHNFLKSGNSVVGEADVINGKFTIDPDGAGGVDPFEVNCQFPETLVIAGNNTGGVTPDPKKPEAPEEKCFDIQYQDEQGDPITPEQIDALVKSSGNCRQELVLECTSAPTSPNLNFTTCDGKTQTGWAGSGGEEGCACGVVGICDGGRNDKCNCDVGDDKLRQDSGRILDADRLPVCQVCLSVPGTPPNAPPNYPTPMQRFKIKGLVCDGSPNLKGTCQSARSATSYSGEPKDVPIVLKFNKNQKGSVACKFTDDPPVGAMVLNPRDPVNPPGGPDEPVNVTITYITVNINIVNKLLQKNEYCRQKIFFFCVGNQEIVTGGVAGYYDSQGNVYGEWHRMPDDGEDVKDACSQYKDLCDKCGKPLGFMVVKKEQLPVASLYLGVKGVTVVVDHVECLNIKRKCQDLMDDNTLSFAKIPRTSNRFLLDPDGPLLGKPFVAKCKFYKNEKVGVTEIPVAGVWKGKVNVKNQEQPGQFEIPVEFENASPEQARSLTKISEFCWQNIKYECSYSPLLKDNKDPASYYYINATDKASSFGTDDDIKAIGCACGKLGTCSSPDVSCNCDAKGPMGVDQGAITDPGVLPVVGVFVGGQTDKSNVDITLSPLSCGKLPNTPPRDCQDGKNIGSRFTIDYKASGEFLISPAPKDVKPFMVYCDFEILPGKAVTVIKPKFPTKNPIDDPKTPVDIPYQGPDEDQIRALVGYSAYCYQAVKFECQGSEFLKGDAFWLTAASNLKQYFWGGGKPNSGKGGVCACGKDGSCGGLDSYTGQRDRRCNCDYADDTKRSDAGIITQKEFLPVLQFNFGPNSKFNGVNITIGDLICSQDPIPMNECEMGFHDCHPLAQCKDMTNGYRCICPKGWEGKDNNAPLDAPRANGRECIDDKECSWNPCSHTATCINTPGSFVCQCKPGFERKDALSCKDINECKRNLHDCHEDARCENLFGSYRCACKKGYRGDGKKCRAVGECKCFGDPHCLSFDSRWLHYQGLCEYVMSQDNCDGDKKPTYRVLVKHWRKNSQKPGYYAWVQSVRVILGDIEIKLDQDKKIIVNGIYYDQFIHPDNVTALKYYSDVVVRAPNGLEVSWDGKDGVTVVVPDNRKDKTCGLCGNFNSDPADDWTVGEACEEKEGAVTDNFELFGNSWTVLNSSEVVCKPDCDPEVPPDPRDCKNKELIALECNKLLDRKNSPFKECLGLMTSQDIDQFRVSCSYDLCFAGGDFYGQLCHFAENINKECVEKYKKISVTWRNEIQACEKPKCKNNMKYMTCGPASQKTCSSQRVDIVVDANPDDCYEGCFCAEGLVMDADKCIPVDDCGCLYNNQYIQKGQVIVTGDCQMIVTCVGGDKITTDPVKCGDNAACSVADDGKPGCYCVEGYKMNLLTDKCEVDKCYKVNCSDPKTECVEGKCHCKMGFIGDCNSCVNIDECAVGTSGCNKIGQRCIDTPGSFRCECEDGFVQDGKNNCDDIDECKIFADMCGDHSECTNTLGSYSCQCCSGYKKNKNGKCIRDTSQPKGGKCCACEGDKCTQPGKVCGTDGETYGNYRSLAVTKCRENKDIKVNYPGECQSTCETVKCQIPYQTCEPNAAGVPTCGCPTCQDSTFESKTETVCATNKITYTSICHMKASTCEAELETKVEVESIGKPCGEGDPIDTPGPWSEWGECSEKCKQGEMNRTREVGNSKSTAVEIIPCFSTCPQGPCTITTCKKPAQVCTALSNGQTSCKCPVCDTVPEQPVCARLGLVIKTYKNPCELEAEACQEEKADYEILEPRACEDKPIKCGLIRGYVRKVDDDGCFAKLPINEGQCYGGCDATGDKCCYPTKTKQVDVILACNDFTFRRASQRVIEKCDCIDTAEAERLKKEENGFKVVK